MAFDLWLGRKDIYMCALERLIYVTKAHNIFGWFWTNGQMDQQRDEGYYNISNAFFLKKKMDNIFVVQCQV